MRLIIGVVTIYFALSASGMAFDSDYGDSCGNLKLALAFDLLKQLRVIPYDELEAMVFTKSACQTLDCIGLSQDMVSEMAETVFQERKEYWSNWLKMMGAAVALGATIFGLLQGVKSIFNRKQEPV